jgi:hypothetical protein
MIDTFSSESMTAVWFSNTTERCLLTDGDFLFIYFREKSILPPQTCLKIQFAALDFDLIQVSTLNFKNCSEYTPFTIFIATSAGFFYVLQIL